LVSTCQSVFSSFIIANYHVGDILASFIVFIFSSLTSALSTLILVCKILVEDLVVFLSEMSESVTNTTFLVVNCFYIFLDNLTSLITATSDGVLSSLQCLLSTISFLCSGVSVATYKCGEVFSLVGDSLILLASLVPRTVYLLYLATVQLLAVSAESLKMSVHGLHQRLVSTSPQMLLGLTASLLSVGLAAHFLARIVRERNITWATVLGTALWLFCTIYIFIFESIVRCLRVTVRLTEMTISNLRVPMFAHAGDSDDEEEDRENLVASTEESDQEENERRETKRRNYLLLRERASKRRGSGEFEEDLLREVEREREDKLCCICQDHEKCIMMLPCRHLCICERCQAPLTARTNTCPMCRKPVKQMIKAYL